MFGILILLLVLCYLYNTWINHSYWKNKGIKGPTPLPIVGNYGSVFFTSKTEAELIVEIYHAYPEEKLIGIYKGAIPVLLVKDLNILKQVHITEAKIFLRPPITLLRKLDKFLVAIPIDQWKPVRQIMEPIYQKHKFGKVTHLIEKPIKKYVKFIDELINKDDKHETYSLHKRYALEMMAVLAFNKELNGFEQESEFQKQAQKLSAPLLYTKSYLITTTFPPIMTIVKPFVMIKMDKICDKLKKMIATYIHPNQREKDISQTILDYLLNLKEKMTSSKQQMYDHVDDDFIVQQCVSACLTYESIANIMACAFYELAVNQIIQNKAHDEITRVLEEYGGQFRADAIFQMKYLEMVLDESMRLHAAADFLDRECTSKFTFSGSNLTIDKGVFIYTVLGATHLDPKIFPNPEVFDPERFSHENRKKIPRFVYMPLGDGPRECIGKQAGKFVALLGLAVFLQKFRVLPCELTKPKMEYYRGLIKVPAGGVWVAIQRRSEIENYDCNMKNRNGFMKTH